jgi:hypothetical protein
LSFRLSLETLETRTLPSVNWPGLLNPVAETEPNGTLDQAQDLGDLSTTTRAEVVGTISNNSGGGGVDWYSFQLDRPADVRISTPKAQPSRPSITTISLYNSDPLDWNDPYDPLGNRLLEQADSATQAGTAQIERKLAPGTYYVAVSGSGNDYFNPYLANSGYAGATGKYGLLLTATDLGFSPNDGPVVLATDPQPGAQLGRSPFLIRVDLSEPLDPNTVSADGTVQLITNPNGTFGDGNDQPVSLASVGLNTSGNELLIAPAAPLSPGYYEVVLAGNSGANPQVLADLSGNSLGADSSQPSGADYSYTFLVTGNEGLPVGVPNSAGTPDDTPANSHRLGDISKAGLVQVAGAIGDDSIDPNGFDGSDVDLYHFQVSGTGRYALTAEVFAGRIGSPLLAGLSLFHVDPLTGNLDLLSSNAGSENLTLATNGTRPLYTDPVLSAGLQPGDYYLAVSNNFNVPDPVNNPPGANGVFNPTVSQSGQNGGSTGDYVLNLYVQPTIQKAPQVLAVTPKTGARLNAPPVQLTVQFSEPVNLPQLALEEAVQGTSETCAAVFIESSNGTKYYPRLESYDMSTNQATFMMLDRLGTDTYQLHLSGPLGIAGLGGSLVGNDASGDYVATFKVNAPARGTGTNPLLWSDQEPNDSLAQAQSLGVLFPHDLQTGVTLQRDSTKNPASAPADMADYYRFQILETGSYTFNFVSSSLPSGVKATLLDITGTPWNVVGQPRSLGFSTTLQPGIYFLHLGDWQTSQAAAVKYTVVIQSAGSLDNPVPLTVGPAPAIRLQPVTDTPPNPPGQGPNAPRSPLVVSLSPASTTPPADLSASPGSSLAVGTTTQLPTQGAPAAPEAPTTALTAAATQPAPPVPSASVALLVNLLVPTGVNNAVLTVHGSSNRPAELINLPAGVLLTLGAGPVGGIKDWAPADSSPSADRLFIRLPSLPQPQPEKTARVTIESGANGVDFPALVLGAKAETTNDESVKSFDSEQVSWGLRSNPARELTLAVQVSEGIHELVSCSYEGAVDAFFSLARGMEVRSLGSPPSVSLPQPISTEAEPDTAERSSNATTLDTARAPTVGESILAIGLAMLTAVTMSGPDRRRAPSCTREKVVRW